MQTVDSWPEEMTYTNWANGQPSATPGEDNLVMRRADGAWYNVNRKTRLSSLCEFERKLCVFVLIARAYHSCHVTRIRRVQTQNYSQTRFKAVRLLSQRCACCHSGVLAVTAVCLLLQRCACCYSGALAVTVLCLLLQRCSCCYSAVLAVTAL